MKDESVLGFLMEVSCLLEEGVAPTVLQLLQAALCPTSKNSESSKVSVFKKVLWTGFALVLTYCGIFCHIVLWFIIEVLGIIIKVVQVCYILQSSSSSTKRASSEDSEGESRGEEAHCAALVAQINR